MITYEEYLDLGGKFSEGEFEDNLPKVILDLNTLTFNRIDDFDKLTPYQQCIIRKALVDMIDYEIEYLGLADVMLRSYSINGVSVEMDTDKIEIVSGVVIRKRALHWLNQTGLTCRLL